MNHSKDIIQIIQSIDPNIDILNLNIKNYIFAVTKNNFQQKFVFKKIKSEFKMSFDSNEEWFVIQCNDKDVHVINKHNEHLKEICDEEDLKYLLDSINNVEFS